MGFQLILRTARTKIKLLKFSHINARNLSTSSGRVEVYQLRSRGIVKVKGSDAVPFLQGLITNDVSLLGVDGKAQYSMLLNVQGRVLYDLFLYDVSESHVDRTILMDCDRSLLKKVMSDISRYKIRKKVTLEDASEKLNVFTTLNGDHVDGGLVATADPRVPSFGSRVIAEGVPDSWCVVSDETGYHERRLQWGIPEGPLDIPHGVALPLESNLVYMNGVNFSKGCYLGQELTARTHHTGVTRKRLMPLIFDGNLDAIEPGQNIQNDQNKSVGKFRSVVGQYGLGLMRVKEISGDLTVTSKSGKVISVRAEQPAWWPVE
ncbi:CAF17-like protein [Mya arenaria]|uniref:CAF17-like protein n=1 Tax=Mya arenaria TaxID=6604 RepID=A0ABY7FEE2_MYAAR|nr:putative transferase CAF17 homolog, mitochondrial [Mya arenaria]WAR19377.1 CAF17-like protein [Mya arenaria]